jgi:hypothetical protein
MHQAQHPADVKHVEVWHSCMYGTVQDMQVVLPARSLMSRHKQRFWQALMCCRVFVNYSFRYPGPAVESAAAPAE